MIIEFFKKFIFNKQLPQEILLEITSGCNLNCQFCFNKAYIQDRNAVKPFSSQQVKSIIDKVAKSPAAIIRFTGGEPLLRKDIFELMQYAHNKGLKVWLNTNATLIKKAEAKAIAKYVQNVLIPLNAYDQATEAQVSNANIFKCKLKGIKYLQQFKVPRIRCGTVATKENIVNLEKIFGLVKRLKISEWELFREMPLPGKAYNMTNQDIADLVNKLIKINTQENKNYLIANAIPFCAYDPEKLSQVALGARADDGHSRFVIDPTGKAKPMYYLNEFIGDIFKTSISKMWQMKFMRDMRNLKLVPLVCEKCRYLKICKGGSRYAAKVISGEYGHIDPLALPEKFINFGGVSTDAYFRGE